MLVFAVLNGQSKPRFSYSYSAEGGTRTRIVFSEYEYEYHFIEYEYDRCKNGNFKTCGSGPIAGHVHAVLELVIRGLLRFHGPIGR